MFTTEVNPTLSTSIQGNVADLPHVVLRVRTTLPWVVCPTVRNSSFELFGKPRKDFSSILDVVASRAPLRRNTDPAEVADTAVFLASDLGRGVTGNILFVDAGMQVMGF